MHNCPKVSKIENEIEEIIFILCTLDEFNKFELKEFVVAITHFWHCSKTKQRLNVGLQLLIN